MFHALDLYYKDPAKYIVTGRIRSIDDLDGDLSDLSDVSRVRAVRNLSDE